MKYSIIVCAYNEEKNIAGCLTSLRDSLVGFESNVQVIVVDNSSIDNTFEEISKVRPTFDDLSSFIQLSIKHVPLSISRNTGLSQATGDYVIYIDADAKVRKDWFSKLTGHIDAHPEKVVFSGKVENLSQSENDFSNTYYRMIIEPSQLTGGSKLIGANMAFKRTHLESVGGFSRVTARRGDEVFVLNNLVEKYGEGIESFCEDAVVLNEFPNSYGQMLKIVSIEAMSFANILFKPRVKIKELIIRSAMALSWLISLAVALKSFWVAVGICLVRIFLRIRFLKLSFACCAKHSLSEAIKSLFINSLNVAIFDIKLLFGVARLSVANSEESASLAFEKSEILKKV